MEDWELNPRDGVKLERVEMRLIRWMCRISLGERKTNDKLRKMWTGAYLGRRDESGWLKRVMEMKVEGSRRRGNTEKDLTEDD